MVTATVNESKLDAARAKHDVAQAALAQAEGEQRELEKELRSLIEKLDHIAGYDVDDTAPIEMGERRKVVVKLLEQVRERIRHCKAASDEAKRAYNSVLNTVNNLKREILVREQEIEVSFGGRRRQLQAQLDEVNRQAGLLESRVSGLRAELAKMTEATD